MVGADSLIESPKASSQNYLLQALALALAAHVAMLATQQSFLQYGRDRPATLNVSIRLEEIIIDDVPVETSTPKKPDTLEPDSPLIKSEAPPDYLNSPLRPRIKLSTIDENFKRFIQSETARNTKTKEKKLGELSATFEPYFKVAQTPPETSYSDFQGVLGGGQYKVFKNGKVTCELNMVPLSFDDHVYGAGGGTKDCTPQKKFNLNLRKNTRD